MALQTILSGCADIQPEVPRSVDTPLRSERSRVLSGGVVATVSQNGVSLSIAASKACKEREDRVVVRTTTTEYRNTTTTLDWTALAAGVIAAGAGAAMLVDAKNVYADNKTSRTYNPQGPNNARLLGAGLLAGGGLLLTIPVVDLVRSGKSHVATGQVRIEGPPSGPDIACPNDPVRGARVALHGEAFRENIGQTGQTGELDVNLDEAIDRSVTGGTIKRAEVLLDSVVIGSVDLKPFMIAREGRAWAKLRRAACREPSTTTGCQETAAFLRDYPDGPHAGEAGTVLREGQPKIDALFDREAWATVDLPSCLSSKSAKTVEDVNRLCSSVRSYRSLFPRGARAEEAAKANDVGDKRAATLEKQRAIAEKTSAAKAAREAAAEQARERQGERQKCEEICRMGCSSWQFRGNEASCLAGCVHARCQP